MEPANIFEIQGQIIRASNKIVCITTVSASESYSEMSISQKIYVEKYVLCWCC